MDTPLTATTTDAVMAESTTVDTLNSEDAMETEAPVQQQQAATATTTASSEEEDHALRHTKPRFDYAIGEECVMWWCWYQVENTTIWCLVSLCD